MDPLKINDRKFETIEHELFMQQDSRCSHDGASRQMNVTLRTRSLGTGTSFPRSGHSCAK